MREKWKPASGSASGWRVVRYSSIKGEPPLEELSSASGRRIYFRTMAAAQRKADQLNESEVAK